MSTGAPTVDREASEKAWEEIRQLIDELARMAKSDVPPAEFYTGLLDRVVAALAAVGGAVWVREGGQGPLQLQYQINLDQTGLAGSEENRQRHRQLLIWMLEKGESTYIPPHAGLTEDGPEVNPSDFLLLVAPLVVDDQVIGVLEVFKQAGGLPSARKGYLRFLNQMCGLAADFFKNHQLRSLKQRQTVWGEFEQFTRLAHQTLNARQCSYTLANEGRRFIDADRVSVAIKRGGKCKVEAISGQDLLNRRSNTVRLLNRLCSAVIRTDEPFWYTDETVDVAPQIEYALHEYVDESHARALAIIPLRKPPKKPEKNDGTTTPEGLQGECIGALIVERFDKSGFEPAVRQRIESVTEHASIGLHNALQHSHIFLLPLWKALGKLTWLFRVQTLPKTAIVLGLIAAVVYVLGWVPYKFELEGGGMLQPEIQHDLYASIDGHVLEVSTEHGWQESKGDSLVSLRNRELEEEYAKLVDEIAIQQAELDKRRARRDTLRGRTAEERQELERIQAEIPPLEIKLQSLKSQRQSLQERFDLLTVRSPVNGVVTTWNVKQQLLSRPLRRGDYLMTLADTDGDWGLEVRMPEDRMGHILAAQDRFLEQALQAVQDPQLLGPLSPELERAVGLLLERFPIGKLDERAAFESWPEDRRQLAQPVRGHLLGLPMEERVKIMALLTELRSLMKQEANSSAEQPSKPTSETLEQIDPANRASTEDTPTVEQLSPSPESLGSADQAPRTLAELWRELRAQVPREVAVAMWETVARDLPFEELIEESWFERLLPEDRRVLKDLRVRLLAMPESQRQAVQKALQEGKLKVTFILATDPNNSYVGRVRNVAMSAQVEGEEGNVVLLTVDFDLAQLTKSFADPESNEEITAQIVRQRLRPGAEVTAKVYCGQQPIGYVFFHDVINFIQAKVLFRLW